MAHISYVRQVQLANSATMASVLPMNLEFNNFAIFGGQPSQRIELVAQAIARYAGKIGIVVIHKGSDDGSDMVRRLSQLPSVLGMPGLQVRSDRGKVYDPLYGLTAEAIVDLLVPEDPHNPMSHSINTLRAGIRGYLRIMEYQFRKGIALFGDYPYNLNLLDHLASMPYTTLENTVLRYFPNDLQASIKQVLNVADIQQGVAACVGNLTSIMEEYWWQKKDFTGHTGVSIINSVSKRQVISMRVPNSNSKLLNYIDAELRVLNNQNIPFLLVNCDVNIAEHGAMQKWFLNSHAGESYFTAIVADSMAEVTRDDNRWGSIFSQYQQVFVLKCASDDQAQPFSSQFGHYYRRQIERSHGRRREPLHILPSHQHGVAEHYIAEPNIRTEDLTGRPNGLLLCGSAYELPILIDYFDTTGGVYNGTPLS